jgi:hypothetical protein
VDGVVEPHLELPLDLSPAGVAFQSGVVTVFRKAELDTFGPKGDPALLAAGTVGVLSPLVTRRDRAR